MNKMTTCLTSVALIVGALVMTAQAQDKAASAEKMKLQLELPPALFTGTPKDVNTKLLEPPRAPGSRPAFYVPKGVTNVALKKNVTCSDPDPIEGPAELVTDGDKSGLGGSYLEMGPGKQWVQIDLDKTYAIYAVAVWHFHAESRVYHSVVAQVSDDPDFIKDVQTIFNNDQYNSIGLSAGKDYEYLETHEGKLIDARGVKGRYVRLYSKGNTFNGMNHYTEVEVFGKAP